MLRLSLCIGRFIGAIGIDETAGHTCFTVGGVELMSDVSFTTTIVINVLYMKGEPPPGPMVFVMNPELIYAVFIAINNTVFGITVMLVLGNYVQSSLAGTIAQDMVGGRARNAKL